MHSNMKDYRHCRFNALLCDQTNMEWAVSQNHGTIQNQGNANKTPWTWMECCDICFAIRSISANQGDGDFDPNESILWDRVLENAPVLRMTQRTKQQCSNKWNKNPSGIKYKMNDFFSLAHPWR